ncbi:MAG: fused MFS/spermidine synthase [Phycisphaerae bacterium]|nr:fused MFS/spermidine synthase [Phycisphaerae bacterium]
MLPLFTLAIFLSATLLFLVQPMVGKLVLPLLGGSPSVWNTVMLFFQGMLLAGYGYAHALGQIKDVRRQILVHGAVMLAAAALLPIGLPRGAGWEPDPEGFAPLQVLTMLAAACAGPVFVLCSASPLLQAWFARTRHRSANDPYFLYAASNVGSMTALLSYPLVVEPNLTLSHQRAAWSVGFGALIVMLAGCALVVSKEERREASAAQPRRSTESPRDERALTRQRLMWLALSFVPAGLMMGATQHITIDIAAVPLLWVLPLSIYLLTFILAFARGGVAVGRVAGLLLPAVVVGVAVMAIIGLRTPTWLPVGSHLLLLFLAAMACHGRLAGLRPGTERLTEFYLLLSVGGVLAGIVCGITAPAVFNGIVEYPLFIVGACLLREPRRGPAPETRADINWARVTVGTLLWIVVLSIVPFYVFMMAWLMGPASPAKPGSILFQLCWIVPACLTLVVLSWRWLYAAAVLMLLSIPWFDGQLVGREILQVRTFFGVHRVVADGPAGRTSHRLVHGRTEHGRQWRTSPLDREPMAYFTRSGPVGDVFRVLDARPEPQRLAVIGLGAGTFAAYGNPGRSITFYEIDPVVKDIATDPDLFSYIRDSASPVDFVLGDARLTVARAEPGSYDLIAMDAFSSDAVPVHLITREAVALYLSKLKAGGLLLFNVSNLYIDFEPVLSMLAEGSGLVGMIWRDRDVPLAEQMAGKQPSAFIVLARTREDLGSLMSDPRWSPLARPPAGMRVWTDDYSDLLSVVKWK